jgi:hypothetical protein
LLQSFLWQLQNAIPDPFTNLKLTYLAACNNLTAVTTKKNPAAVALGRAGGKRRAEKLSPERRREIARNAVNARWSKRKKKAP